MCERHDKALKAIREFVIEKKRFTLGEITKYVMEQAETTRVAPARDLLDWLEDAKELGYIREVEPFTYELNDK